MIYLPEVAVNFDRMVTSVIHKCFPAPWVEDDITYELLRTWRADFGYVELHDFNNTVRVSCRGYKFRGTPEYQFGDIALRLSINFADGASLTGVGFLEAKRKGKDSAAFAAVDHKQLRRIGTNAPNAQLLLYDYQRITGYRPIDPPLRYPADGDMFFMQYTNFTHAVCLPVSTYLGIRKATTGLYKHAAPLSEQVWYRFMYGLDLHHGQRYERAVASFEHRQGGPNFVMDITVAHGNRELPSALAPASDFFFEIE